MTTGNNNQRVTNAIIKRDIEHLTALMMQWHEEDCIRHDDFEQRLRGIERMLARHDVELDNARRTSSLKAFFAGLWATGLTVIVEALKR